MFASCRHNVTWEEIINTTPEIEILALYFDFPRLPFLMCSPFRKDSKPSFECFSKNGKVFFFDFSTRDSFSLQSFLCAYWNVSYPLMLERVYNDLKSTSSNRISIETKKTKLEKSSFTLNVKVRTWRDYDFEYWKRFGIEEKWILNANIYPISFYMMTYDNGETLTFGCDKYAYAYYEKKEGKEMLKIYQPYNNSGWKWLSSFRDNVISLWTKIPEKGSFLCICSSLKDALCLWSNTGIPAIAPQGEGYNLSDTVIKQLKERFKYIFVLYDNDKPGIEFSKSLCKKTGFIYVQLPFDEGCKDISDLCAFYMPDKEKFKDRIRPIFKKALYGRKQENQEHQED